MKISFLVTYYNQAQYVKESMESILRLKLPCDWEILVGDDGSSDDTVSVVRSYMEKYPGRIFLYVMDREPGKKYEIVRRSSANRLNLTAHMTGDFFCCFDGDDYYCDDSFVIRALEVLQADPEISAVAFGYKKFSEEAGDLSFHTLPTGPVDTQHYLSSGAYTPAAACVFRNCMSPGRQAALKKIGYYDDNDILINNLAFGGLYAIDRVIYAYRQTGSSTYNAMDFAERAVLNAQGYDVDVALLPGYRDALLERNRVPLLRVWFLRKSLPSFLGQEKWQRYLAGCRELPGSLTARIMEKSCDEEIRKVITSLIKQNPKNALRLYLQCLKCRCLRK